MIEVAAGKQFFCKGGKARAELVHFESSFFYSLLVRGQTKIYQSVIMQLIEALMAQKTYFVYLKRYQNMVQEALELYLQMASSSNVLVEHS